MIGLLYMFYALALVCDHYFVPTLDVIIERYFEDKGNSPNLSFHQVGDQRRCCRRHLHGGRRIGA